MSLPMKPTDVAGHARLLTSAQTEILLGPGSDSFPSARIDGPNVWIDFSNESGVGARLPEEDR